MWVGFGMTEKVDANSNSFIIRMDDRTVLYPIANEMPWFKVKENQRVLVNYTILGDRRSTSIDDEYHVRINSIKDVLYKGIFYITPETEDSIGNDPIHVEEVWMVNNMLNFELEYYGSNKTHYINLVRDVKVIPGSDGKIVLELRHNDRGDAPYIPMTAYVTFNLDNLKIYGRSSVSFKVNGVDFHNQRFTYDGVYKY